MRIFEPIRRRLNEAELLYVVVGGLATVLRLALRTAALHRLREDEARKVRELFNC